MFICMPTISILVVTSHLPGLTFGFDPARENEAVANKITETISGLRIIIAPPLTAGRSGNSLSLLYTYPRGWIKLPQLKEVSQNESNDVMQGGTTESTQEAFDCGEELVYRKGLAKVAVSASLLPHKTVFISVLS